MCKRCKRNFTVPSHCKELNVVNVIFSVLYSNLDNVSEIHFPNLPYYQ